MKYYYFLVDFAKIFKLCVNLTALMKGMPSLMKSDQNSFRAKYVLMLY